MQYGSKLRQVAKQVESIIKGLTSNGVVDMAALRGALHAYSEVIGPWARSVAEYMIRDVARRDRKAWHQASREIGVALRAEIDHAPTGAIVKQIMEESVTLIKSIPLKAAEQVHELVLKNATAGERSSTLIPKIIELGSQTTARARTIARTETARCASALTQARAQYVGSEAYKWRTVKDSDVRDSHAEMEGKVCRWDTPPTLSDGTKTHPGMIYNCRCWAEPILPELED